MISYLKGSIIELEPTHLIIEVGGVGYHVIIPMSTYDAFKSQKEVKVLTHFHVKEDSQTLYGFYLPEERTVFLDLIGISGIGPSTAIGMLSAMNPNEIKSSIVAENVKQIQSIKGIGGKTAQRVILELKDRYKKEGLITESTQSSGVSNNSLRNEALSALINLGFAKNSAEKVIDKILQANKENITLEQLIKQALKSA
ncbi:Holliday junction ATP-dependent DNA helicase RuvA [Marivirga tractuosa]|uniref:Holliday junction branch migration complex subunit RuvA n=1 Tax=Marivirga tractuosa (strain ATCC 23168 / DSM 4126 / NBRC 15989 / NCIMB 1408 / VKM B-1430 / H-43) TaxID=643867 RepID=E4TL33_MARTH|nr:Holliday junction branch migration protein RuvA [Marivirga tractuosa]ADR23310.1 Holliday junction DNA helicase RuvA [Marivirga tractuosa DSM 4126]BDD16016.1 Holliday junction ATP-dependent DNA helicase RuvA [Marivirga tractuosa]